MIPKLKEKEKAIKLRKRGFSYSEILKEVPVAKSTLSLWLKNIGLAKKQKQRLTEKKLASALRGARAKRTHRLVITEEIKNKARNEIGKLSDRELWLIGIALYWAEGSKQKEHNVSQAVKFSNSDPLMVRVFLQWLQNICKISKSDIYFRIAIHETAANRLEEVQRYWANTTGFSLNNFLKTDWKKHKINTRRKNVGDKYYGLLNIYIKSSTNFNRKIQGWIGGISKYSGIV